jgi:NAD(P)-dependent dehydrogenase (short-subunit alcohol dehydrogenase family)
MSQRLKNKIALITGGNSGIGRASAKRFIAEGAQVIITGRHQKTLDETVAELGASKVTAFRADTARPAEMKKVFESVKTKHGRLDVLFLNAGIAPMTPLESTTEQQFEEVFAINVKGVFFAVQAALPLFGPTGGSILITSSGLNSKGLPGLSAYSATKAAVRSFARSFSAELKGRGIRVNCVSPGPIDTPLHGRMGLPPEQWEQMAAHIRTVTPAGRFGEAWEIAECAVFLASDESKYVLGADFAVDGGFAQL